jgi:hypothetical protein
MFASLFGVGVGNDVSPGLSGEPLARYSAERSPRPWRRGFGHLEGVGQDDAVE